METNLTMYCSFCGSGLPSEAVVCSSCGKNTKSLQDFDKPSTSQGDVKKEDAVESSQNFRREKEKEKPLCFKKKKEPLKETLVEESPVKISVGLMGLKYGVLSPVRGKTLPLSVKPGTDAKGLHKAALTKLKAFDKDLPPGPYFLLYPDGSKIEHIPGTNTPFSLKVYKEGVGKAYQRITVYICTVADFMISSQESTTDSEESDSDVIIMSRNAAGFSTADTVTWDPALNSTSNNDEQPPTDLTTPMETTSYRKCTELYSPVVNEDEEDMDSQYKSTGYRNRRNNTKLQFYRIPEDIPAQKTQRQLWLNATRCSDWTETNINNARVCSAHFISGEASVDAESPDFVPSVFSYKRQNGIVRQKMERLPRKKKRERQKMQHKSTIREITEESILELRLIAPGAAVLTLLDNSDTDTASECDKVEHPSEPLTPACGPGPEQEIKAESCKPVHTKSEKDGATSRHILLSDSASSMANEILEKKDKVLVTKSSFRPIVPEITEETIRELRYIAPGAAVLTLLDNSDTDTGSECDKVEHPADLPEPLTALCGAEQKIITESCAASMANEMLKKDEVLVTKSSFGHDAPGERINYQDLKMQQSTLHQAYTKLVAEAERLRAENEKLRDSLQSDFSKLSYRFLKWDAEQVRFLTGLPPVAFDWLVSHIEYNMIRVHPEVKAEDHLLIVLMKLKMGLCDDDLGYRFGMDGEMITAICQTWIPELAAMLRPFIEWQSDAAIRKSKPDIFKTKLTKCCCFLDCLEFAVASHKGGTRHVKYFVGTTPAGAISFLPPGFSRNVSEKQVIKESGFFGLFKTPSQILASRTFPIKEELRKIRVNLHTRPRGFTAHSPMWSHVNAALGWWKDFGIFETTVPAAYEEMMDDVVIVCAALTNLKISLVPNFFKKKKRKILDSV